MTTLPPITPETADDQAEVEDLIAAAFGPGRLVKTAERLRETNRPAPGLSVVAREAGALVGCARMWPVHIGAAPALLLGPFAVADSLRGQGLGRALIEAACERAGDAGHSLVLLVGDAAYFARMGFTPVERDAVTLPGPVDMRRVLVRALSEGAAESVQGMVRAG